jgi:signal transduction histidine kinase
MDVLTTLVVAWAAVYGYVAVYYGLVYLRRPSDREYVTFALISAGMCVYSAAKAALMQARTPADAIGPSRLDWVGILICVAFFVDHCHALVGRRSRLRTVTHVFAGLAIVAGLSGWTVDSSTLVVTPQWGLGFAPPTPSLEITPLGTAVLVGCLAVVGMALIRLVPALPDDRDVRFLFAGASMALAAGAHDLLVRSGLLRSFYLLEHTALLVIITMSYMLLHRFVRTNEELRLRTEELHRSYAELRRTQEKLVRKEQLAAVGELSAVIAHEVRNPLAIIKNAVSGLRRPNLGPGDHQTLLGILKEETGRLARLVDDLLAYAQPMVPQDRPVHLDELVWGAVDLARSGNPSAHRVVITVDLQRAPDTVHGDPALLRQALMNIIDNAMQAMPSGGDLSVRARTCKIDEANALAIDVQDSGEGMDALVRQKACNPFYTTRPAGTGLGLAIVERVVRNHGGRLDIESRHGVGTTVTMVLPHPVRQAEPPVVEDATPLPATPAATGEP